MTLFITNLKHSTSCVQDHISVLTQISLSTRASFQIKMQVYDYECFLFLEIIMHLILSNRSISSAIAQEVKTFCESLSVLEAMLYNLEVILQWSQYLNILNHVYLFLFRIQTFITSQVSIICKFFTS